MDFLKTSWTQISDLFRSMTPGSRMLTILLLAAVVISFGYLFAFDGGVSGEPLMYGEPIPFASLPGMESAFETAGLNDYTIRGNQIYVPAGKRGQYMAALTEAEALPPNFATLLDSAFSNLGSFPTTEERKEAIKSQKQKLLSWVINAMNNIQKAMVMIDEDKPNPLSRSEQTAMVSVSTINGQAITKQQILSIRYLVAGAIAGLKASEVTIVDQNGTVSIGNVDGDLPGSAGGPIDPIIQRKEEYETELTHKIYEMLSFIPNVKIGVSYEIDPEASSELDIYEVQQKPVTVLSEATNSTTTSQSTKPGGRVGFAANASVSASVDNVSNAGTSSESANDTSKSVQLPTTQRTKKNMLGFVPKRGFVSIAIPNTYFFKIWESMNKPADGSEPQTPDATTLTNLKNELFENIKDLLVGHLPEVPGLTDPKQQIQLMAFTPPEPAKIPEPSSSSDAMAWLMTNWGTIGAMALVLISLLMIRSITKQPTTQIKPDVEEIEPIVEESEATKLNEGAIQRLLDFGEVGPSLRDELAKLVDQDPQTAANILRNWIGVAD